MSVDREYRAADFRTRCVGDVTLLDVTVCDAVITATMNARVQPPYITMLHQQQTRQHVALPRSWATLSVALRPSVRTSRASDFLKTAKP